tara:strand:- start:272 stop:490 length:219 start_codon:yes stop_codon:yes gene_type:complete
MVMMSVSNFLISFFAVFISVFSIYYYINFIKSGSKERKDKALLRELLESFELDIPEELNDDNQTISKTIRPS